MIKTSSDSHKIWIDQCIITRGIRRAFGLENALAYLIDEKLYHFVTAAQHRPELASELPRFVAAAKRIFTEAERRQYLDVLKRKKYRRRWAPDAQLSNFLAMRELLLT
jgi:hypothetical protein